jgi:hypothetical protein
MRSATCRIAGQVGPLIEVPHRYSRGWRGDGNTGTEVDDGIRGPATQNAVGHTVQIHDPALANRQVVGYVPGELILHILGADRVFVSQIPPILSEAIVSPDEAQRRIPVVGHYFSPSESGQSGEVAGQPFLHFGLQRAVLGVASGIAIHNDSIACAVAAITKLRELLQRYP